MSGSRDLTGQRCGRLKVLERLDEREDRYCLWLCQCDCGNVVKVNTKRLTRGTVTDCGCVPKTTARRGPVAENLTGQRFGMLVALRRAPNQNGRTCWVCRCDCGNERIVISRDLKRGKVRSCGCDQISRMKDISGQRFGRLTALEPTEHRDEKGSVYWRCRCDCGQELEVTEDGLAWGNYKSCGCLKKEIQEEIPRRLHRVDGTCVEFLERRKYRKDNTSGFRGVYPTKSGRYKTGIGFKRERYWLGTYDTFEEAVEVRLEAERAIHGGFLEAYYAWKAREEQDPQWAREHPFQFQVEKREGRFSIVGQGMSEAGTYKDLEI